MERYEHEWLERDENGKPYDGTACTACRRLYISGRQATECSVALRSALDAALAERDRLQVHLDRISGALVDADNAWPFDEDRYDEGVRFLTAERDALREERKGGLAGLGRLLTAPMDCGHPVDCLPSHTAQEAREHPERIVCGWCAAEARAERAEAVLSQLKETQAKRKTHREEWYRKADHATKELHGRQWDVEFVVRDECIRLLDRALLAPEAQRPEEP